MGYYAGDNHRKRAVMSGFLSAFPHDHIYYISYTGVRFAMRETRLTGPVYAGRQFLKKTIARQHVGGR